MKPDYDAVLAAPFGALGISTENGALSRLDFLSPNTPSVAPRNALARRVCEALQAYLANPLHPIALPIELKGTLFQRKVWQALMAIPAGETMSYGELAHRLGTAPRAVGQACAANRIPIVVPCHRVLAKSGAGGFMHSQDGDPLRIKRWLLEHEAAARK